LRVATKRTLRAPRRGSHHENSFHYSLRLPSGELVGAQVEAGTELGRENPPLAAQGQHFGRDLEPWAKSAAEVNREVLAFIGDGEPRVTPDRIG
jgi:hypothetical protein